MINKKSTRGQAIDFLNRAVSTDETRYWMNGIHFDKGDLNIVATDGRRMHMITCNNKDIFDAFIEDLGVDLSYPETNIYKVKAAGSDFVATEKIAGQFPNYHLAIPEDNLTSTKIALHFIKPTAKNSSKVQEYTSLVFALGKKGYMFDLTFLSDLHSVTWDYIHRSPESDNMPSNRRAIKLTSLNTVNTGGFTCTAVIMPMSANEMIEIA